MANTDQGYLLHSRAYGDTSTIADFFLQYHGRISLLYKGVRKAGKQGAKGRLLQPFSLLAVSFEGRSELKSGRLLEPAAAPVFLTGSQLYSGLYVNELLVRLLHREEACAELCTAYQQAVMYLQNGNLEVTLRRFEQSLLRELGYELTLQWDVAGNPIEADAHYLYQPDQGWTWVAEPPRETAMRKRCFVGRHLLAIHQHQYDEPGVAASAKQLMRLALAPHLGDKPLRSRELFKQLSG
jgi:DNA repair protein RecO (recombination protein O)